MSAPDDQLRRLDERAAGAAADLTTRAGARPVPAFDPGRTVVTDLPTARPSQRGRALAVAAVVLVIAAVAGVLLSRTGDDGDDKAKVISGDPRPYVVGDLPEGFSLAGAGEITRQQSADPNALVPSGPTTLYGPAVDDPRLAIAALRSPDQWSAEGGQADVDLGNGRSGYRYDGAGLGKQALLVVDEGSAFLIVTPGLDDDRLQDLGAAVTIDASGQVDLHGVELPDGWRELGRDDSAGISNPLANSTTPSAAGNYVAYGKGTGSTTSGASSSSDGSAPDDLLPKPSTDDTGMLMVASTSGDELRVYAGAVTAGSSERTTVRGHDALVTTTEVDAIEDITLMRTVAWLERPGELVQLTGTGLSQEELLAAAESIEPVGPAEWKDMIERSQLGEYDPANAGEPERVKVGEGQFPDGTRWLLGASPSGDPTATEASVHLSVTVADPGDLSSSSSGMGSSDDGADPNAIVSTEVVESGGQHFAGSLVGPKVERIEVQRPDGEVLSEPEIVEGNGYRGFAAQLPEGTVALVAFAADGTELSRTHLTIGPICEEEDGAAEEDTTETSTGLHVCTDGMGGTEIDPGTGSSSSSGSSSGSGSTSGSGSSSSFSGSGSSIEPGSGSSDGGS